MHAKLQHFILKFKKKFLLCKYHLKEGIRGEREGEDRVTSQVTLMTRYNYCILSQAKKGRLDHFCNAFDILVVDIKISKFILSSF